MPSDLPEMPPPSAPVQHTGNSGSRRGSTQPFPPFIPAESSTIVTPMRLPRQLTHAELHMELEKEQEAMVNRLTRELTNLRTHSASVASTASTTSNVPPFLLDPLDPSSITQPLPLATGPTHPIATRPSRSGSNASASNYLQSASGFTPTSNPQRTTRSSSTSIQGTSRYDDVTQHRLEFEEVRRENERLRQRVRELEVQLRERRESAALPTTNGHHEPQVEAADVGSGTPTP